MAYTNETTATVSHLLEVLNERIRGYKKAAENTDALNIKTVFEEYARQAQVFADELLPFSDKVNKDEAGTRLQGDVWHLWMDMKGTLTGKSANAMIEASITGEEAAIKNYNEMLQKDLAPELKGLLSKQLTEIKAARSRIEKLKS